MGYLHDAIEDILYIVDEVLDISDAELGGI